VRRTLISVFVLTMVLLGQATEEIRFVVGKSSGDTEQLLTQVELVEVLSLFSQHAYHKGEARAAEAAYELNVTASREVKRPIRERYERATKFADEALAKLKEKSVAICSDHKLRDCELVFPKNLRDVKLRGAKQ
jgi:hypothetical protein